MLSHDFRFSKTRKNFTDSISTCAGINGKLAEPKSKQINDAYATEAHWVLGNGHTYWKDTYWFGITDRNSEGIWKYVSSEQTVPFTNWEPEEPDYNGDDCVYLGISTSDNVGRWWGEPCAYQKFFVCEL